MSSMWWDKDLTLGLLDPTPVFLPLSEGGFGREGDTLWNGMMGTSGAAEWRGGGQRSLAFVKVCSPSYTCAVNASVQAVGIC